MKTPFAATALIIASALMASSPAFAQLTREQVKAEFLEAVRTGDSAPGERSLKLNELYPNRYPAKQVRSSITREQVMAERESALRTGNYMANAETGGLCKDEHPSMHPAS